MCDNKNESKMKLEPMEEVTSHHNMKLEDGGSSVVGEEIGAAYVKPELLDVERHEDDMDVNNNE